MQNDNIVLIQIKSKILLLLSEFLILESIEFLDDPPSSLFSVTLD